MKYIICGLLAFVIIPQVVSASIEILPKKEQKNIVGIHNMYRNPLKLEKLEWSDDLATSAKKWAIILENNNCPLQHSPAELRNNYGENLYAGWSTNSSYRISIKNGVRAWAQEKSQYQYKANSCAPNQMCGHYTQMVWKNTRNVGCALARCSVSGQTTEILICQYDPPGNYIGELPY